MYINCLELLAPELAMKSFLKSHKGVTVLLQLHTSTAVAYINNLGGTASPVLTSMARSLWRWALERDIMLSAQHTYSRGAEYNSRPQVQSGEGQVGLDAVSSTALMASKWGDFLPVLANAHYYNTWSFK